MTGGIGAVFGAGIDAEGPGLTPVAPIRLPLRGETDELAQAGGQALPPARGFGAVFGAGIGAAGEGAGRGDEISSCDAAKIEGVDGGAPAHGQQECGSIPEFGGLFKPATKRGGARVGTGPKPKVAKRVTGEARWYCVQTEPRQELQVIHGLTVRGFERHFPKIKLEVGALPVPRFPRYVFVRFDRAGEEWKCIPTMRGVARLFSATAEKPTPLRRGYVEGLLAEAGASGFVDAVGDGPGDLDVGEEVRLLDGPLAGLVGRVATASTNWVEVKVGLFGRETPVWAARRGVERVG